MISFFLLLLSSNAFALEVVCTLPWIGDIAHRVAPEAHVTTLARGSDDPHFLSPTPALMARVANADVYAENGLGLELWSEKLLDSAGNPKIRPGQPGFVRVTTGMNRLEVPTDLSRAKGDLHPEGNPHVWLDPLNAPVAADNLAATLGRVDPANASTYLANAKAFRAKIQEATFGADLVAFMGGDLLTRLAQSNKLDEFLAQKGLTGRLGGWLKQGASLKGKPMVFYHQSWPYFVNRFGIKVVGYVEDRPGIPPTAAHRDELVALIKANNVKVIEVTTYYDSKIPTLLAQQTGARVATVAGDVGGLPEASDYFALITSLVTKFSQ
ncbi:MAG: metal ABC transporter substrate-binding protein [Pseudomonadota bacterium]|nr:metal ABC transporter substrate-binding protein [Pseudomonadota bacterium]